MTRGAPLLYAAVLTLLLAGIAVWLLLPSPVAPPPGRLRLVPLHYNALPGWYGSDPSAALAALRRSCSVLRREPASAPMGGAGYAGTVAPWQTACAALPARTSGPDAARVWFERHFAPAEVEAGVRRQGLFTGYYEPQIAGRQVRTPPFTIPVYGRPSDLVTVDLGRFRSRWRGQFLFGRMAGDQLMPYPSRSTIEAKGLAQAPVLFWTNDPIGLFFLQIQGSGRVRFGDGTVRRVDYAGQNGRAYTAIGRTLVHMKALTPDQLSLQSIRDWLVHHPRQAPQVMDGDAAYVFFRLAPLTHPDLGPRGTEGVPLTPGASLAVDGRIHPLGVPFYVVAAPPRKGALPLRQLLIAQDTGGAIKGPVRADVFWGFGARARNLAGGMKSEGRLFVLLPRPLWSHLSGMAPAQERPR